MPHGVDLLRCLERVRSAQNTEESTSCTLSIKIEPDSRGTSPAMTKMRHLDVVVSPKKARRISAQALGCFPWRRHAAWNASRTGQARRRARRVLRARELAARQRSRRAHADPPPRGASRKAVRRLGRRLQL